MLASIQYIPHGHCYLWQTPLVWLHVTADFLIAAAYFSIPITLFYFVRRQQDNPFEKIIVLFSFFIFSCGTTHLMSIWTLWHPDYWFSGAIKVITALISCFTAIELIEFFPFALSLPNSQVLEQINQDLAIEIKARKEVEVELAREQLFLKATLNSLSEGVVACDEDGKLAIFNSASQKFFGKQEPINSQQWSEHYQLYYPDGKTYLKPEDIPLSRAFAGETFTDVEFITIASCQSEPRNMLANGCPIIDQEDSTLGAVVTVKDITDRKQAELQLKKSNRELLQSNQELEQFAYVASHDLREPLRMVISFTQLLAQRYKNQLDDEADTIIGFAVDGAQRMEILIEDLLSYSRLGKQNKTFKVVNCNLVLEKALSNLQVLIKETAAIIKVKSLPHLVGDESQLIQLFQNLLGNAIIYRSEFPPEIEVFATPQHPGWLFSIKDNGIGIDSENSYRIFEIFQRLHPKEEYSGTGIGLAICKKIVERHGGKIWVESKLGSGSDFRLTLNTKTIDKMEIFE